MRSGVCSQRGRKRRRDVEVLVATVRHWERRSCELRLAGIPVKYLR